MAEFTSIDATNPIVIPAIEEKVYDKWWVIGLNISAEDPTKPINVAIRLRPYRIVDGVPDLGRPLVSMQIDDLFGSAAEDPELAAVVNALLEKIKAMGTAQGLL